MGEPPDDQPTCVEVHQYDGRTRHMTIPEFIALLNERGLLPASGRTA